MEVISLSGACQISRKAEKMGAEGGKQQEAGQQQEERQGAAARLKMGAISLSQRGQIKADGLGSRRFVPAAKVVCFAKMKNNRFLSL